VAVKSIDTDSDKLIDSIQVNKTHNSKLCLSDLCRSHDKKTWLRRRR